MKENSVFDKVSIINVKNKLNLHEIYSRGNTIYVTCPFCNSTNGSMKLDITNNCYVCKNCEESGNSISLYAKYKFISNKEAHKRLIKEEADLTMSSNYNVITNERKNEDDLDCAYQVFLNNLELTSEDTMNLLKLGFSIDEIEKFGFKSIPINENEKINICNKLIRNNIDLKGIPGFYQNSRFKWTFKSHNGIFVPVKDNEKIIGLRIHLNKIYNTETTDIWFSSSNKYNGTKASNSIMTLYPKENLLYLLDEKTNHKDIIIVSEMLLAYKMFTKLKNIIIIGVPNVITKNELKRFDRFKNVNSVYLVMDNHTALHTSGSLFASIKSIYGEEKINILVSGNYDIPQKIEEDFQKKREHNIKIA